MLSRLVTILFIITSIIPTSFATPVSTESTVRLNLEEAFKLALSQSEKIGIRDYDLKGSEARYQQARGAVLPKVNLLLSERIRNTDSNQGSTISGSGSAFVGSGKDRFSTYISVSQPIFSGFRDLILIKAAQAEINASLNLKEREKELLYKSIAESFYEVLSYESDLKEISKTADVLEARIKELDKWIKLGKSRDGEIISAELELADLEATQVNVNTLLIASKDILSFLIGRSRDTFILVDSDQKTDLLDLDRYLTTGKNRKDILALTSIANSSELSLKAARREHWPTVSLEGNSYLVDEPNIDRKWDLLFRAELPLFDGFIINNKVKEKEWAKDSVDLQLKELTRSVQIEIKTNFDQIRSKLSEVTELEKLVKFAKTNFQSQKRDYDLGIVTNLEVLQSIQKMHEANRKLQNSRLRLKAEFARLLVASGQVPS